MAKFNIQVTPPSENRPLVVVDRGRVVMTMWTEADDKFVFIWSASGARLVAEQLAAAADDADRARRSDGPGGGESGPGGA